MDSVIILGGGLMMLGYGLAGGHQKAAVASLAISVCYQACLWSASCLPLPDASAHRGHLLPAVVTCLNVCMFVCPAVIGAGNWFGVCSGGYGNGEGGGERGSR